MNTDTADRWTEIGQLFTAKNAPLVEKFASLVASRDLARFEKAKASLDLASVLERCDLLLETVGTVTRTPLSSANRLFQKNAWAIVDSLARDLDACGFSRIFRSLAPGLVTQVPLDDPGFIHAEWNLLRIVGRPGQTKSKILSPDNCARAFVLAQQENVARKALAQVFAVADFSLLGLVRSGCGRPDRLLQPHAAVLGKGGIVAATMAVDMASLVAGIALLPAGVGAALIVTAILSFAAIAVLIWLGC
jgi:hypothetical protein